MSYINPNILLITNPVGLDACIQDIQQDFYYNLAWLSKSFGRAWGFKEQSTSTDILKVPKCYMGGGEYQNVLPNDGLTSQSFIAARDGEKWMNFTDATINSKERLLSCIFWFNMKEMDLDKDYIYTEELKNDVERILKANKWVRGIESYYDEQVEQVFDGYLSNAEYARYTIDDPKTQFLMYPYAGFRFDFMVAYPEHYSCISYVPGIPGSGFTLSSTIELVVGEVGSPVPGDSTWQSDLLIGKKIRVIAPSASAYWSFNSDAGIVSVSPAWAEGDTTRIEIYVIP